tara:strand:- start:219 stop:1049 length:831 start_codon:yes stop_codon:yes gene_type:complete
MYKPIIGFNHNNLSPDITGSENDVYGFVNLKRGVDENITVYVDELLPYVHNDSKYKVAMLVEPYPMQTSIYEWIKTNYDKFDMILTHHKPLLEINDKFRYYPVWPRIKMDRQYWGIPSEKTKYMSVIFSNKTSTSPQRYRHEIVNRFNSKFDLFGTGYNPIDDKYIGTKPYRYQVVVENIFSGYVSEKGNDCFACGTIPIYYGNKKSNIYDYYDSDGFLIFETLDELEYIINNVANESYYDSRKEVIEKNCKLAINNSVHKVIWEYGIKDLIGENK